MPQDAWSILAQQAEENRAKLEGVLAPYRAPAAPQAPVAPVSSTDPYGRNPQTGELDPGPIGGFVASAASSIPELFGQDPTPAAMQFRAENPVAGFVSEVLPTMVPYAGWFKATEAAPVLANTLKSLVAKTGLDEATRPILHGAVKEAIRFAPLELSRLGIGLTTAPEENWGNLFADVGLSTLLAGGFGGIGGFFRKGGQMLDSLGRVVDAEVGLKPAFQLRLLDEDAGKLVGGTLSKEQGIEALTREALSDMPYTRTLGGLKGRGIEGLENSINPGAEQELGSWFKAGGGSGVQRKFLLEGADNDVMTLNAGEQQALLGQLGMKDIKEIAKNFVYPRVIDVTSDRGAGTLARLLDETALQPVGEGVWQAREAADGLWVQLKRLTAPDAALDGTGVARKTHGGAAVGEGDRWFLAKTDKPQLLAPAAGKVAAANLSQWAKMRPGYASSSNTLFNRRFNAAQDMMPLNDFRDLPHSVRGKRQTWVGKTAGDLAAKAGEATGLKNSATARAAMEGLYDAFKPVMFRAADDPLYGRLFGMLRYGMNLGDELTNRIIGGHVKLAKGPFSKATFGEGYKGQKPFAQLVHDLSDEEYRQLYRATQTQTQAEELKKLVTDGVLSPKAVEAVESMMQLNKSVIGEDILPDLVESGVDQVFKPMEEYIAPRIWSGDFKVQVFDEAGRERWLSSAATGKAAQTEAKAVVEEAARSGKAWRIGPVEHSLERDIGAEEAVQRMITRNLGKDKEAQDVITSALRRMDAARAAHERPIGQRGLPATMAEQRTGRAGSPDANVPDRGDFIKSVENHYRTLYHYTAYQSWMNRYAGEAFNLEKVNKNLAKDLQRKAQQMLGVPGQLTQAQDNALKPILGPMLGSKPATRLAQQANELMFNWNLAIANPTFALVNMLSPIQQVLPMVAYIDTVPNEYLAKFMQVVPRFASDGRPKGVLGFMHPIKILGESVKALKNPEPELKAFLERAKTDGTLSAQLYENWVGPASRTSQTLGDVYRNEGFGRFLYKTATWGAEKSEEFSRAVSFNAGYFVGKARGLEGNQLYAFAKRMNELTNFNYGVVDRSRVFTGPIGSVFGLFKNWQTHYIGMMGEFANVAVNQGNFAPLIWQHAGALSLAGLGGTGLKGLADGLVNWAEDDPNATGYTWMQKHFGSTMGDAVYFGLPGLVGSSLQASAAIPGTDVRNELQSLGNIVVYERLKAFGKSFGDAWAYAEATGQNPLQNANIRDGLIAATAPRAGARLLSATQGDYIKSMSTGYAQVRDTSPATRVLHGLGLNQLEVEKQQVAGRELYKDQQRVMLATKALGRQLAQALETGDQSEQQNVYYQAMGQGLDLGSVIASARSIGKREAGDLLSRYRKEDVARYTSALGM